MGLDLRTVLGLLFVVSGGLLAAFGLWSPEAGPLRAAGINVNLSWGLVMMTFGIVCMLFSRRARP